MQAFKPSLLSLMCKQHRGTPDAIIDMLPAGIFRLCTVKEFRGKAGADRLRRVLNNFISRRKTLTEVTPLRQYKIVHISVQEMPTVARVFDVLTQLERNPALHGLQILEQELINIIINIEPMGLKQCRSELSHTLNQLCIGLRKSLQAQYSNEYIEVYVIDYLDHLQDCFTESGCFYPEKRRLTKKQNDALFILQDLISEYVVHSRLRMTQYFVCTLPPSALSGSTLSGSTLSGSTLSGFTPPVRFSSVPDPISAASDSAASARPAWTTGTLPATIRRHADAQSYPAQKRAMAEGAAKAEQGAVSVRVSSYLPPEAQHGESYTPRHSWLQGAKLRTCLQNMPDPLKLSDKILSSMDEKRNMMDLIALMSSCLPQLPRNELLTLQVRAAAAFLGIEPQRKTVLLSAQELVWLMECGYFAGDEVKAFQRQQPTTGHLTLYAQQLRKHIDMALKFSH